MRTTPHPQEEAVKAEIAQLLKGVSPEVGRSALIKVKQQFDIEEAQKLIHQINETPFSQADKARLANPILAEADKERVRIDANLCAMKGRNEKLREFLEALKEIQAWSDAGIRLVLEANDCSRLHKMKEAMAQERVIDGGDKDNPAPISESIMNLQHTFVVKHNWAAAFEKAREFGGEFRLPYDVCTFEFRLSGRTVILFCLQSETEQMFTSFIEAQNHWYAPPFEKDKDECETWAKFLWDQVRAICIALDAEVATHTVIRAPYKLNEKREKQGKPKLLDFHVVDLARRHRVANPSGTMGGGGHKRLHFRRGHWRHFETSKTWVKWCLVGNPDLGFIQKQYRL
jgi:hypothetical protein